VLLLLALGATAVAADATFQAVQRFQQHRALVIAEDPRAIRPWMTISHIARVYHLPETYLYHWLHINDASPPRHVTLYALAMRLNRPVDELIRDIQRAIVAYRQEHHGKPLHPPVPTRQAVDAFWTQEGMWS